MTSSPRTPLTLVRTPATRPALRAVLADRTAPRHELHLAGDPESGRVVAELAADGFEGRGESDAVVRRPTPRLWHIVATIAVHGRDRTGKQRSFEVCAALAWALEPRTAGERVDVAGTALVYDRSEDWTSRYDVVPDHVGNRVVR